MKKMFFPLLSACLICLVSCKNTDITNPASPVITAPALVASPDAPPPGTPIIETPEAYNSYIMDRQKKVYDYIVQMSDAVAINPTAATTVVNEAAPQISRLTNEIKSMPPYKGNDAMRDAAVALFEFYETIFHNQYHQLINYSQKGNARTDAELLQMKEVSTGIITEEKRLNEIFNAKQKVFAEANNLMQPSNSGLYQQVDYLK